MTLKKGGHAHRDAFNQPIVWRTYGRHSLKGFDEPRAIREAGLAGISSFEAPAASDKATPALVPILPASMRWLTLRMGAIATLSSIAIADDGMVDDNTLQCPT